MAISSFSLTGCGWCLQIFFVFNPKLFPKWTTLRFPQPGVAWKTFTESNLNFSSSEWTVTFLQTLITPEQFYTYFIPEVSFSWGTTAWHRISKLWDDYSHKFHTFSAALMNGQPCGFLDPFTLEWFSIYIIINALLPQMDNHMFI